MKSAMQCVVVLSIAMLVSCRSSEDPRAQGVEYATSDRQCAFPTTPAVLKRSGAAVLLTWTVEDLDIYASSGIPDDSAFAHYRHVIVDAGADLERPPSIEPELLSEEDSLNWQKEIGNVELVFSDNHGTVRPIQCLEALLFAHQNARYSQLDHPTEFIASVLRREDGDESVIKVFFAGSDQMFPPNDYYGFDELAADLNNGWSLATVLHNHTLQQFDGQPVLGPPAPSTSDIQLLTYLASSFGLRSARVTNGFFTADIPADAFSVYNGRSP